ncbi:MAG TPA: hypothetical protein VJC13_02495 [Candidatus Paceibacterota bacterium]
MKKFIYAVLAFAPVLAFAQNLDNVSRLVDSVSSIVGKVIPIMFALAIIYFFWGLIQFIRSAGDPKLAAQGKSIMIYGVIAIAVMLSIYGLVRFLNTSFGISDNSNITVPGVTKGPTNF